MINREVGNSVGGKCSAQAAKLKKMNLKSMKEVQTKICLLEKLNKIIF